MKISMPNKLSSLQEEILTGTLLGDACLFLPNKNGNPYLSIKRKPGDRDYLEWQASFFQDFANKGVHTSTYMSSKRNSNGELEKYKYTAVQFVSRCAPAFLPVYNKWYPNGTKIVPRDLKLSPMILSEWFCDDGCVSIRKNGASIKLGLSVMGFSDDDIDFLRLLLDERYNERFCVDKNRLLYCSDAPARLFVREIDGHIPPGMNRKAIWRSDKIDIFGREIGKSRLKRKEEINNLIIEFININKEFSMIDLAKHTGCHYMHHGKLEPDYETLKKYLSGFNVEKSGKLWKVK